MNTILRIYAPRNKRDRSSLSDQDAPQKQISKKDLRAGWKRFLNDKKKTQTAVESLVIIITLQCRRDRWEVPKSEYSIMKYIQIANKFIFSFLNPLPAAWRGIPFLKGNFSDCWLHEEGVVYFFHPLALIANCFLFFSSGESDALIASLAAGIFFPCATPSSLCKAHFFKSKCIGFFAMWEWGFF